ncbi:MAG: 50S ribosomal protein L9 [Candidatus Omnitrophota bacterium]
MRVVVIKEMNKIGKEGDVVDVKDGYARNYLIPKGIVVTATQENLKRLEVIKKKKIDSEEASLSKAKNLKASLEEISLTLTAEAKDNDEIYGSINEAQIVKALKEEGVDLDQKLVKLDEPIRKLGVYDLKIKLHAVIEANLRVWIVKR